MHTYVHLRRTLERERERGKEEKEKGGSKRDAKEESVGRKRKREGEGRQTEANDRENSKEGEGRREKGRKTMFTHLPFLASNFNLRCVYLVCLILYTTYLKSYLSSKTKNWQISIGK